MDRTWPTGRMSPWGLRTDMDIALMNKHIGLISFMVPVVGASTHNFKDFDKR